MNNTEENDNLLENIVSNPKLDFLTRPEYTAVVQNFVSLYQNAYNEQMQQYQASKVLGDLEDGSQALIQVFKEFLEGYKNEQQNIITAIEDNYVEPTQTAYTSDTDALNEVLRRQDVAAHYSTVNDKKLKSIAETATENITELPVYDEQVLLNELEKRNIDFDRMQLVVAREEGYKSNSQYINAQTALINVSTYLQVSDNELQFMIPNPDYVQGQIQTEFLFPHLSDIKNDLSTGISKAIQDKIKQIAAGGTLLNGLSHNRKVNSQKPVETVNNKKYQVADNDPRIEPDSTKYSWLVSYSFLTERFGDEPKIKAEPRFDVMNKDIFDIQKKYKAMYQIYKSQKAAGIYKPLKQINTNGRDPLSMSDQDINKLFGKAV